MGFLSKIKDMFSIERGNSMRGDSMPTPSIPPPPRYGGGSYLAFNMGGSAMNVAAVYRCVEVISGSVANLPMMYKRQRNGIFEDDVNSRLHYLLTVQPEPRLSAVDFWKMVVQYLLLEGNAYIVPVYNVATLELDRLALVDPATVTYSTTVGEYTIRDANAAISGTYGEEDIIHLMNYTYDGVKGISTVAFARTTTSIALTGDNETLDRFANGGNVRGFVSNDTSVKGFGEYQDTELQKTAVDLDSRFRSGERIVSLPGQAQFSPISLSSTDMQFLESRKFTVRDICRWFGVHPSFVFDDTSNNYKSAEMANVAFLSNTLNPLLRKIECELLRKLVAPSLAGKRKFEFDRRGLYACDLESRIKYQTASIAAGLYTVNEWRAIENKPTVKGGDTVLVSANLKGINEAAAPKEPQPKETNNSNNEEGQE